MWQWDKCPEKYRGGLQLYFNHHVEPGSFLTAVLKNDLFTALGKWDGYTVEDGIMHYIAWIEFKQLLSFLYNEVPSRSNNLWGNEDSVAVWLAQRSTCAEGRIAASTQKRCPCHAREHGEFEDDLKVDRVLEERGLSENQEDA